ncbi:MAG: hypothetical protein LBV17_07650 [Treponema sp.]|jgi:hypothetical protein|nr:hypothetical protein [Treponema sp.]
MNDPSSPQGQALAESQRRREQQRQEYEQYSATQAAKQKAFEEAQADYYRSIKDKYGDLDRNLSDEALRFIAAAQPAIDTAEDPQYMKERIAAADMYSNLFNVSFQNAFLNLENFHQQWIGEQFVKKTGWKAVADSVKLSFVSKEYNELTKKLAEQGGKDPDLLKAVQEYEQKIDQLRDHAPKIWQDDYVKMGGWDDVGQLLRGVGTSLGENALPILEGMGWATLAATGAGAFGASAKLSATASKILVAGASRLAIAGSTYNSTWGIKYREMTNQGIPHDIAHNYARLDALVEGAIEGALGGVEAAGAQTVMKTVVPEAVSKATTRFFISGRMGGAAKAVLNWLKEGIEEGSEELLQGLSSGANFNVAVDKANYARREEQLREIASKPFEETRKDLEKELENLPEIEKKKWRDIFDEAFEGGIAGFLTGLVLGIPVEIANYRHDVQSALQLVEMARAAPNEAVFKEMVGTAKEQGFQVPMAEEMKSDEEAAMLSDVFKVQQERLTPEQRAEKQKQAQDAAALSEVTDYRNTETIERTDEETGETITELATPDTENVYRENGRLGIDEYTDTNEDGSINGRFVAGDPSIEDKEESGKNQYGYINYTQNGDTVPIDEFKMLSGYENLRADLFQQFSERFAGMDITWNPQNEGNIALRDQLVNQNPRGVKNGLNYYENNNQIKVSNEARQVAARIAPHLEKRKSTPLEIALATELVKTISRRPGESLTVTMNRLIGRITNNASERADIEAAQKEGKLVKGATWTERTAEGMRRVVYYNKNASDVSTVIHELAHAVEYEFSETERKTAIDALNGYKLKDGTVVNFDLNTPFEKWEQEQRNLFSEAFAEGFENYLTNGTAPNEQIKSLFEKVKEFMKRVYEKMKGWTELSPKVEEFYKSLFSGEVTNQSQTKTSSQTRMEGNREAQNEKTLNDTGEAENATEAPQERSTGQTHTATYDHTAQRDEIISDPDIPLEEKTEAIFDAAGEALYQAEEYDPNEDPINCLKASAQRLTDTVERNQVVKEIDELARMYPPEGNKYLAPNGKTSNLNHAQWYAVRTPSFKNWFGDWESAVKIAEIEKNLNEYTDNLEKAEKQDRETLFENYDNTPKPIAFIPQEYLQYFKKKVTDNRIYTGLAYFLDHAINRHTDITADDYRNIQKILNEADEVIRDDRPDEKDGKPRDNLLFVKDIGKNLVLVVTLEEDNSGRILLHKSLYKVKKNPYPNLTRVRSMSEGGVSSISHADQTAPGGSLSARDNNIIGYYTQPVKPNSVSKIVDENGEPLAVYHGTKAEITEFDMNERIGHAGRAQAGSYFTQNKEYASTYGTKVYSNFLNIRNPYITDIYTVIATLNSQKINTLIDKSYDGVVYNELAETDNQYTPEYDQLFEEICVFNPNQIKSATDNAGTFDPNTPSILFQTEAEDIEKIQKNEVPWTIDVPSDKSETSVPIENFNNKLIQLAEFVKPENDILFQAEYQLSDEQKEVAEIYKKGVDFNEAQASLFSLLDNGKPITLQNLKTGDEALLSKSSIGKLLSNEAVRKSMDNGFSREQHYAVVSDIVRLFNNAEKLFARPDKNNDPNVKIHRYATPLYFGENVAMITVKESVQHGKRIYSAELMEIEKLEGILKEAGNTAHFPSSSSAINNLINKVRNVNTLFQLSNEQKETIEAAKEFYGTTTDFREAGYLLVDGTMLDLSGKREKSELGHGFMSMGNIRLKPEIGGVELTKSPNKEQTSALRNYIKYNKGDVIIDFSKENLDVENSIEYSGANSERVLNDIKNYYEKGELPPEVPILFQTAWNASVAMFDRFDNYYAGKSGFSKAHGWGHSFYSQREAADWFSKKLEEYKGASGWLYEAKIPDDTELLDWEKTLDNQPEAVKNTAVQLITWDKDGMSNFNDAYNLRKFKDGKYGFFRSINGKMKWETIESAKTAAKSEIMKALDGKGFYSGIAQLIGEKSTSLLLDSMGIKGIKYLDKTTEKMGLQASHSYTVFGDQHISMTPLLFQIGDRDMIEEAASFDSAKEWREYCEAMYENPMGEYETEIDPWATEEIDAWYKTFWEKARKAVKTGNTEEQSQETIREGKATPAELDREFIEEIEEEGALEDFIKTVSAIYNEDYSNWGAIDEADAAERGRQAEISDNLRKELKHPDWQSALKSKGEISETRRKQLLTLIERAPRDYRAIYAEVMEREDFAVSAEDRTAAILKHRITDSRRKDVDSLTPEKLRQLSEQLDIEEFAELVRTGRAKFNDPIEKAYIKQLKDETTQKEERLKEVTEDRDEDNQYIEKIAGKEFFDTFERATKAAAFITVNKEKLDKAIKTGEKDAARITWQLQRANSTFNSIVRTLQAMADAHKLEVDIKEALSEQAMKDYAKSAKTEATLLVRLARKAERERLTAHLKELKEKQQAEKEITKAKKGVVKRTLRSADPRSVNAEHGMAMAVIQKLAEPSMLEGLDRFIGGIEKPYLREIFERWNSDEQLRNDILKNKARVTQEKINKLLSKEKFEELTNADKKYLFKKIPPKDWATALGLEEIIDRRNENYPNMNEEVEKQIALKYLPSDVYFRLLEKPFSEWTLSEAEELAKIIDNLYVKGKEIYKANIDAERRRIREYQNAVRNTIRTVIKKGKVLTDEDEAEKILGKYDEGVAGTAQGEARRRKAKAPLFGYADMNVYRFARMLDNGNTNGKNSALLYRRTSDAYNQEKIAIDTRTEKIQKLMKDLKISESELWEKSVQIDLTVNAGLGVKGLGIETFTASELLGVISASRDEYSRDAVVFGNFLNEEERGLFQRPGVTRAELTPLELVAEERFSRMETAAKKLLAENPNYQKLLDAIDEDFTEGGQRLSESLLRYNNTYMPIVKNYFPMHRKEAVSANTADAKLARELMGTSNGAFNLFVEKGFTNKRKEIPPQYQTGIKLDILGVWTEAVNKEEHFMAYGQLIKDLNQIYKNSRQVTDAIRKRYGRQAVEYINKYINELTTPNHEKERSAMDNFVRSMRGKTASAYLAWKVSAIAKQFLTSPAPFFAYMNPIEYWGTFVEFAAHRSDKWNEIISLSAHMKHRDANLLIEIVNEQAKQKFENKADAFISKFNKKGMEGLQWIDQMCVAPGWLVLFRKEQLRLTKENSNGTISDKDIRVKAAQYADDIVRLTQPSSRVDDLSPFFKGNNELGKAYLQFTQSLNVIWQNIRYDLPQMIRDKRYKNAAGTIIGYTIAGIMLGAITAGFDDDDDTLGKKAKKCAWWATTQFTDAFPLIGSEATHVAELLITGKMQYSSGLNLFPTMQKWLNAGQSTVKGLQQGEFDSLLKASAQFAEAAAMTKGLPVSGAKELGVLLGIGDKDGELDFNPEAVVGRR